LLLRSATQTDSNATYLWMITAPVEESELSTPERRRAVEDEAHHIAQEFFDTGSSEETIASVKLKPFATRVSLETYIEAASRAKDT
jgi:hypothetical protein